MTLTPDNVAESGNSLLPAPSPARTAVPLDSIVPSLKSAMAASK
jgi:hypothetical protein